MLLRGAIVLLLFAGCAPRAPGPSPEQLDASVEYLADAGPDGGEESDAGSGGGQDGGEAGPDLDGDGLGDAREAELAARYFPFLSVDPADRCPRSGVVFRLRPHAEDPELLHVVYVILYERDCGLTSHVGDNEVFAITVNPSLPPPAGITALKAIGHQNTPCEKVSTCGVCNELDACYRTAEGVPIVYVSKDKHANYVDKSTCRPITACGDQCTLAPQPTVPPLVNAGEPGAPLVNDLTTGGFITEANGWTEQRLFHFDPWKEGVEFGTAGSPAEDLVDPEFDPPPCR